MAIFILQDLLTHDNLTTKDIFKFIISGLIGGAIGGFIFGWIMGVFSDSKILTTGTGIDLENDETILFETGANHFKGIEGVGGKLYLTNKRLLFKSHKYNIQNHELSIPLSNIESVGRYRTFGITNNGISITSTGHSIEKFVVQRPEKWTNQLATNNGLQQMNF